MLGLGSVARAAPPPSSAVPASAASTHSVTYDGYSFVIDGRRMYLWSGEFHYFRLPSQDLWRDVLQKMKAAGVRPEARSEELDVAAWGRLATCSPRPS